MRHLLAALRNQYDIKEPKFQRRHPSVIKAHMLILAQACRKIDEVDSLLEGDLQLVLAALPRLWDEALVDIIAIQPTRTLSPSVLY